MKAYLDLLLKTKTGRLAGAIILGAVAAYLKGEIDVAGLIAAVVAGVQSINIRDAIRKSGPEGQ